MQIKNPCSCFVRERLIERLYVGTHRIRKIRMIISVLFWLLGNALFADFLARIVPKFRCDMSDFDGFSARLLSVF